MELLHELIKKMGVAFYKESERRIEELEEELAKL